MFGSGRRAELQRREATVAGGLALQQSREGQRSADACDEAYLPGQVQVKVQVGCVLLLSFSSHGGRLVFSSFLQVRMRGCMDTSRRFNTSLTWAGIGGGA